VTAHLEEASETTAQQREELLAAFGIIFSLLRNAWGKLYRLLSSGSSTTGICTVGWNPSPLVYAQRLMDNITIDIRAMVGVQKPLQT